MRYQLFLTLSKRHLLKMSSLAEAKVVLAESEEIKYKRDVSLFEAETFLTEAKKANNDALINDAEVKVKIAKSALSLAYAKYLAAYCQVKQYKNEIEAALYDNEDAKKSALNWKHLVEMFQARAEDHV